jgi:hypothetical protein
MTQDHRKRDREFLILAVLIGLADAGGHNPDQHLVGARSLHADRLQPNGPPFSPTMTVSTSSVGDGTAPSPHLFQVIEFI